MGSDVGSSMHRKMAMLGASLAAADVVAVVEGAKAITEMTRTSIRAVAPSGRLRGVGKKGAAVGARYDVKGKTATVQATGPVQLIERDTKAHTEGPKVKSKGKGKGGKRALSWGGGDFASAVVSHPGTKGKHPFAKGIEAGTPAAETLIRNRYVNAARKGVAS